MFEWCRDPKREPNARDLVADDFTCEQLRGIQPKEDWLYGLERVYAPLEQTRLGDMVESQDGDVILVFTGTDPVTALRHRVGWFLPTRGDRIVRLNIVSDALDAG
ncbi:MAG TPA: hypothetical protein VIF09_28070 [Polyangiaceae bacterium]